MNAAQCKMARAGLGWRAQDLADRAGVGYATVARFESGSDIASDSLEKLVAALADAGAQIVPSGKWAGAVYVGRETD